MKKRLSSIFIIIIIIFILIYVICKIFIFPNQKNMMPLLGYGIYKVASDSMAPSFHKNNYIVVKKEDEYNIGDIATYVNEDECLITHRIVGKYKNEYKFKGDANNAEDSNTVDKNNVIGKVIYIFK